MSVEKFEFGVTYDYRCPFARNLHEHLVAGLRGGAEWEVEFIPFSLTQTHIEDGEVPVWDNPALKGDRLAIEAGLVVREHRPEQFHALHLAMFQARHDEGRDLRQEAVVRDILESQGVEADAVVAEIEKGWPGELFREAHERVVKDYNVFGVPTYVLNGQAAFVRVMTRPNGDPNISRLTVERVLYLMLGHPEVNEFKRTVVER